MPTIKNNHHQYEVFGLLWLSRDCQSQVSRILADLYGVPKESVRRGLHLTVYHGMWLLPGMTIGTKTVKIVADASETRFMVMAPGGENPRPGYDPAQLSVGIRLTKRNMAIPQIQELRRNLYALETEEVIGNSRRTSSWKNSIGARQYQPHITLLNPGSGIDRDLSRLGKIFRSEISDIIFDRFETRVRASR